MISNQAQEETPFGCADGFQPCKGEEELLLQCLQRQLGRKPVLLGVGAHGSTLQGLFWTPLREAGLQLLRRGSHPVLPVQRGWFWPLRLPLILAKRDVRARITRHPVHSPMFLNERTEDFPSPTCSLMDRSEASSAIQHVGAKN